ncbi:MAG: histidine phosphatase family protein [Anaerolineae bacterium]|nr:histidine phosphatase family protein [Anaerolineae bacterium]MDW8098360.1 histidine phosphatase family protein [Anaerolineae bacterium]
MSLIAYLIRHAEPEKGTGIPYDVPPGPPLSMRGREEAQRAAAFLADKGIQRLFCSPLVRARDTAEIIGHVLRLQPVLDERLAEHRSGETFEAVIARMRAFWEAHAMDGDGPLALVTHGSPIRALLTVLGDGRLDWSRYQFADNNIVPTAGIWQVEQATNGWKLELVFVPSER